MTKDEYDAAWPKITRRLHRLCDEFGWETVLHVFAGDMPEHREEREREQQERRERRRLRSIVGMASVH